MSKVRLHHGNIGSGLASRGCGIFHIRYDPLNNHPKGKFGVTLMGRIHHGNIDTNNATGLSRDHGPKSA
jgi:hypothetical protein